MNEQSNYKLSRVLRVGHALVRESPKRPPTHHLLQRKRTAPAWTNRQTHEQTSQHSWKARTTVLSVGLNRVKSFSQSALLNALVRKKKRWVFFFVHCSSTRRVVVSGRPSRSSHISYHVVILRGSSRLKLRSLEAWHLARYGAVRGVFRKYHLLDDHFRVE